MKGTVHINVILKRDREPLLPYKSNKYYIFRVWFCSVSYPSRNVRAPHYIVLCGLCDCAIFFHVISQTVRFSKKESIEHKMSVWIFFKTFV